MSQSLASLPAHAARYAAELPTLAITVAARAATLVGEGTALVRRDGPVAAAQSAAQAAVAEAWSVAGRIAPGLVVPRPPAPAPTRRPPSRAAREAGAPGVATPAAEAAAEEVARTGVDLADAAVQSNDLPLADFDHMTLGSLRGRLRTLSLDDLVVLRAYEEEHARRLQVLTMLENRIARVRSLQQQEQSAPSRGNGSSPGPA
jgi:hypothetical protein